MVQTIFPQLPWWVGMHMGAPHWLGHGVSAKDGQLLQVTPYVRAGIAPLELSATAQVSVARDDLVSADAFTERFAQLLSLGYPWINLCAAGLLRGALLVTVELPTYTSDINVPAINVVGPPAFVRQRAGWWVDDLVLIQDAHG
jgi:hypothetical protein